MFERAMGRNGAHVSPHLFSCRFYGWGESVGWREQFLFFSAPSVPSGREFGDTIPIPLSRMAPGD